LGNHTLDNFASEFTKENNALGREFFIEGNLERAVYHFTLSLEQDENEEAYFYLGLISNQIKKIREALSYFYKSIQKNSEYGNPCNEIGVILLRHGREKEAVYWLKKSIRCNINDARHVAYYNLATLYKLWNRPERSLQYLHHAIGLEPNFAEALKLREELLSA
jgi:tetratricopeptide (TPR) repeat protein